MDPRNMPLSRQLGGAFTAYQMPPIQQRRDTSREKELNRVLDRMDGPWMGSPELQELACYSYPPGILSCLQSVGARNIQQRVKDM